MHRLFVVGTDTGVGKTYITCKIAQFLRDAGTEVGIYKPVCSGAEVGPNSTPSWPDVEQAWQALQGEFPRDLICPQLFHAPLAPNVAAACEGRRVDPALIRTGFQRWQQILARSPGSVLLIEGAGGWLSPLSDDDTAANLAHEWHAPVLIVAAQRLGTINHTLLTVESVHRHGVPLAGVLLNTVSANADPSQRTNSDQLRRRGVPVWGTVEYQGSLPAQLDYFAQLFDAR